MAVEPGGSIGLEEGKLVGGGSTLKKLIAGAVVVGVTLIVPVGAAFADKLPGGRPPCSIIRKSPASGAYGSLCESFP
jgi:hypothetical protein